MFSTKLFVVCCIAVKHKLNEWLYAEWALSQEEKTEKKEKREIKLPNQSLFCVSDTNNKHLT